MTSPSPLSPWQYKPWWCQPWSITLTGVGLIGGSWLLLGRWWITALVALPVGTWMVFFLLIWPRLMMESGLLESECLASEAGAPEAGASEAGASKR